MIELEKLISDGDKLLSEFIILEKDVVRGELVTKIHSLHVKGRFILRKIDKQIFKEYCDLFSITFSEKFSWVAWNWYMRTQLEKCMGIFRAINETNIENVIDKSLRKVFISHGKLTPAFTKLELFIRSFGLTPLFDTNTPSQAKAINTHVANLISESDFYIILATNDTVDKSGKKLPNHNVVIEFDRMIQSGLYNIVVLLEKDCKFPSMQQDIIYETFTQESMDNAFIKLSSEFVKNNLIY